MPEPTSPAMPSDEQYRFDAHLSATSELLTVAVKIPEYMPFSK
jgi:hypothetical protein